MGRSLVLPIALVAGLSIGAFAQNQQPSGFHSVACVKVRDGKMADFQSLLTENTKLVQAQANAGMMSAGYRLRSVMPAGDAATCDYVFVTVYPGAPPAPRPGALEEFLKKAGSSMTAAEFMARRAAVAQLVSYEMWRTAASVGEMSKGDYVFVNHMVVHDMANWLELENSVWKPMAQAWVKDGTLRGWMAARPVLPEGTGLKYQAVTVDVVPSWDSAFKPLPLEKTFKQIHPDKDANSVMEKIGKARDLALREFMVVEDKIVPATKAAAGGQ